MNHMTQNQVDMLITLIKENPILYDPRNLLYKNFTRRERTWKEISDTLDVETRHCKSAWRTLRDNFIRTYKERRRNYRYYNQLFFLSGTLKVEKKHPELDESEMIDSDSQPTLNPIEFVVGERRETMSPMPFKKIRLRAPTPISPQEPAEKSNTDTPAGPAKEEDFLKEFLSNIMTEIKSTTAQLGSREQFFLGLASMIGNVNLTNSQSRELQRRIFNFVVDELEKFETDE